MRPGFDLTVAARQGLFEQKPFVIGPGARIEERKTTMNQTSNLSDELKAKIKNCKTDEELKNLLAAEEIELDPGMLGEVNGGTGLHDHQCPVVLDTNGAVGPQCPPIVRWNAESSGVTECVRFIR